MLKTSAQWSDERVAQLKVLWADGLSASQIAAELGGVSRNAVIGKVHRLGLSGRKVAAVREPGSPGRGRYGGGKAAAESPLTQRRSRSRAALAPAMEARAELSEKPCYEPEPEDQVASADVIEMVRHLTLAELGPNTCRWPIGDPRLPSFRFCGAPTQAGEVYCRDCARKAYVPAAQKRHGKIRMRNSGGR